jgi:ABC-type transporter Mla subunit MlaD
MRSTIEGTATRSSEAAGEIISEVRNLNEQSVQKYLEVIKKQEDQMDRVDLLKQMLKDAVEDFGEFVTGYNEINDGMRNVSQDVKTAIALLSQTIEKMQKGQDSLNKLAEFARDQVEDITHSQEKQEEIWKGIETSMVNYRRVFQEVEGTSAHVLTQISAHLQQFSRATQDHFTATVTVANEHVNTAVGKLGTSIEELSEKLDDLSEVVSEINTIRTSTRR